MTTFVPKQRPKGLAALRIFDLH